MTEPKDWLTKREAAEYLKVSVRQITRLALPRTFVGSSPRYDRADLDEYLQQRKVVPRQQTKRADPRGAAHVRPRSSSADWLEDLKRRVLGG